jgi:hypothetical protein
LRCWSCSTSPTGRGSQPTRRACAGRFARSPRHSRPDRAAGRRRHGPPPHPRPGRHRAGHHRVARSSGRGASGPDRRGPMLPTDSPCWHSSRIFRPNKSGTLARRTHTGLPVQQILPNPATVPRATAPTFTCTTQLTAGHYAGWNFPNHPEVRSLVPFAE